MTDRRIRTVQALASLRFDSRGLIPVVAQDRSTDRVLMVAWANRDALERTLETGLMHYWSRSRGELWKKGATSGNVQRVAGLHADCDGDTVLARVTPEGTACHTGEASCFGDLPGAGGPPGGAESAPAGSPILEELWNALEARALERPEGSYTLRLLEDENLRLKKLGEETAELVWALARGGERAPEEAADLVYHVMVAVLAAGRSWDEVEAELRKRRG